MPEPERDARRRPLSFGLHQGLEYLVGLLLALTAVRLPSATATPALAAALVVVVLPLVTNGPLGGFRWIGRRTHQLLDVVLLMVLAASPAFLGFDNFSVVILAEMLAVIFAVLVRRTSYASPKRGARPARPRTPAPAPAPRAVAPPPTAPAVPPRVNDAIRTAGRVAGKAGRDGPRALGRFVGRRTKR